MEMLPNKTRVGVGIMKVHCTETIVSDSTTATPTSATLVFNEHDDRDDDRENLDEDEEECTGDVEMIEKITDSPMFQRKYDRLHSCILYLFFISLYSSSFFFFFF